MCPQAAVASLFSFIRFTASLTTGTHSRIKHLHPGHERIYSAIEGEIGAVDKS